MTMDKHTNVNYVTKLRNLIDSAFCSHFKKGKSTDVVEDVVVDPMRNKVGTQYSSIKEYTEKTGKRFRMTKDQKQRGLTRQEAFTEIYGN